MSTSRAPFRQPSINEYLERMIGDSVWACRSSLRWGLNDLDRALEIRPVFDTYARRCDVSNLLCTLSDFDAIKRPSLSGHHAQNADDFSSDAACDRGGSIDHNVTIRETDLALKALGNCNGPIAH
jgi:hypothetical protein